MKAKKYTKHQCFSEYNYLCLVPEGQKILVERIHLSKERYNFGAVAMKIYHHTTVWMVRNYSLYGEEQRELS